MLQSQLSVHLVVVVAVALSIFQKSGTRSHKHHVVYSVYNDGCFAVAPLDGKINLTGVAALSLSLSLSLNVTKLENMSLLIMLIDRAYAYLTAFSIFSLNSLIGIVLTM